MAHVKAEARKLVCGNALQYGKPRALCDYGENARGYCAKEGCDVYEVGEFCEFVKPSSAFIERDFRCVEAEEHDGTYDGCIGYYDLRLRRGIAHVCSYLEIDGRVYCDEREPLADSSEDFSNWSLDEGGKG